MQLNEYVDVLFNSVITEIRCIYSNTLRKNEYNRN